jgi:PAS domain S-box-containing protein
MEPYPTDFAERLVGGMADAIVYADAEGVIRMWNRGATRIFGFAEAEALGCSLDLIIPESLRERHWQGYRATMRTGQSRYGDGQILSVPAVRKDGTRISVEFTIVAFKDDTGQMVGIAAIMRDVTARFEELRAVRRQLASHPAANPGSQNRSAILQTIRISEEGQNRDTSRVCARRQLTNPGARERADRFCQRFGLRVPILQACEEPSDTAVFTTPPPARLATAIACGLGRRC